MREQKAIVAVNRATNEVKKFKSINEAARELGGTFCQVQRAMFSGGSVKGQAIYGSAEIIQSQIDDLQKKLEFVKSLQRMFVDELFEKYLVEEKRELSDAISQVFVDKLEKDSDKTLENIKMVENGYQCFRKKHPEFPKNAVKVYVLIKSPDLFKLLNW